MPAQAADFDRTVLLMVHSLSSPGLTLAIRTLTWLGSAIGLCCLAAALFLLLWRRGFHRQAWFTLAAIAAGEAVTEATKLLVRRQRPESWYDIHPGTWSFPSGHALESMFCYLVFWAATAPLLSSSARRTALLIACLATSMLVGFTRIYLSVHWPTDVLTGWIAGACLATGVIRGCRIQSAA